MSGGCDTVTVKGAGVDVSFSSVSAISKSRRTVCWEFGKSRDKQHFGDHHGRRYITFPFLSVVMLEYFIDS